MEDDASTAATLPRDLNRGGAALPPLSVFRVDVVRGADAGAVLVCDPSRPTRALVGKSATCDLRLSDALVSRRHLALEVTARGLRVTDLDSTNGTFLSGVRVRDAWLAGGESVAIGETVLCISQVSEATSADVPHAVRFGRVLGASREMQKLYPLCEGLAAGGLPVIIEGETGTGKEVLAESIHDASPRAGGPFVVFDCAATPPTLIESALFGHERGAFTGADSARAGAFELAHGGTLFLDELGELPLSAQPKLLRALARSEIQRVGSNAWRTADVRVLAATRRDLDREVQEGRFREDLFYRLAVGRIELPPLRERSGDILILARHFWRELSRTDAPLPRELGDRLLAWHWPGNVRELENAIARYVAIGELEISDDVDGVDPTDDPFQSILRSGLPLVRAREKLVEAFEQRYIERVLARHDGNVSRAAASSGIARRYFQLLRAKHRAPK